MVKKEAEREEVISPDSKCPKEGLEEVGVVPESLGTHILESEGGIGGEEEEEVKGGKGGREGRGGGGRGYSLVVVMHGSWDLVS